MSLIDITVTFVYQSDQFGLWTSSLPATMLPACANCNAMCLDSSIACVDCRVSMCGKCTRNHVINDFNEIDRGHSMRCWYCANVWDFELEDTDGDATDSTQNTDTSHQSGGGSTKKSTFHFLRQLWLEMTTTQLKAQYWVTITPMNGFSINQQTHRDIGTWMALALKLETDHPHGIIVLDVLNEKSILFTPGEIPKAVNVNSAISRLRTKRCSMIGIAMRDLELACVDVDYEAGEECVYIHEKILSDIVAELSRVTL